MERSREQRIKECGKYEVMYLNDKGQLSSRLMYCGIYYGEDPCPNCKDYESYVRKKVYSNYLNQFQTVYRKEVALEDWDTISRQLRRKQVDGFRIPNGDDGLLVFVTELPYRDARGFTPVSGDAALKELSTSENLFPSGGNRSGIGSWRVSDTKDQGCDEYVETEIMFPAFKQDVSRDWWESIFSLHATTWTKGTVSLDNVQEYVTFVVNKGLELSILSGMKWDISRTKVKNTRISQSMIDNWSIASSSKVNLEIQGDSAARDNRKYQLQLNAVEPVNYLEIYKEDVRQRQAKEELGDSYSIFYPEGDEFKEMVNLFKATNKETFLEKYTNDDLFAVIKHLSD